MDIRFDIEWCMEGNRPECIFQGQADAEQLVMPAMNMPTDFMKVVG